MTVNELLDMVHQHHPHMGEAEILNKANRIIEGLCREGNIFEHTIKGTTAADRRYYNLKGKVSRILKVSLDNLDIPRIPEPPIDDIVESTTDEDTM
jgi:hypothetical protein